MADKKIKWRQRGNIVRQKKWIRMLLFSGLLAVMLSGCKGTETQNQEVPANGTNQGNGLVRLWGPILETDKESLTIDNRAVVGARGEIIITVHPEQAEIVDGVNGFPVELSELKKDEVVFAYIEPALMLSEPPVASARMVICRGPSDLRNPDYVQAEAMEKQPDSSYILTADDSMQYQVPADCEIVPYLTRNRVKLEDIQKGTACLVWSNERRTVQKIVLFADV